MSYGNDTLFVTDLDGTLMRNDKSISQKSADIINSFWNGDEMSRIYCSEGEHTRGMLDYIDEHRNKSGLTPVSSREGMFEGNVGYVTMIDSYDKLLPVYERMKDYPCWECILQLDAYSPDYWLEICPENCTKSKAILKLKERFGFKKIVAFRDSTNDIPMFRIADEAYAVSNADDKVKEYATDIIESNEEDGVAKFLQKHLL